MTFSLHPYPGILYLLFSTFPGTFSSPRSTQIADFQLEIFNHIYGFNPGVGGLAYVGIGIGLSLFGAKIAAQFFDQVKKAFYRPYASDLTLNNQLTARNNGVHKPEFRILLILASFLAPIDL
jgi:hypothetical protein